MGRQITKFPVARIKKIMQMDEEVGKVAQAVPVLVSKALEMFMQSLIDEAAKETRSRNAKKMSVNHLKRTICSIDQFDFLKDVVAKVPDLAPVDDTPSTRETQERTHSTSTSTTTSRTRQSRNVTSRSIPTTPALPHVPPMPILPSMPSIVTKKEADEDDDYDIDDGPPPPLPAKEIKRDPSPVSTRPISIKELLNPM